MIFYAKTCNMIPNLLLWLPPIILLLLFHCLIGAKAGNYVQNTSVGVIIDVNSESGKQQTKAMQIAAQTFNNYSNTQNIILLFRDSGKNPLQAASAAEELITQKKVKVIIGMETWQEAVLVADLGTKTQVPTISFSAPSLAPPLMHLHWPFLIHMTKNETAHMNCIAEIIHTLNQQKVIAIYEDNPYSSDSGMLSLLSEALEKVNSRIEYRLVLPSFNSLSDPKGVVLDELLKLLPLKSRIFVVLQASLPMVTYLFREAKKIGFLEEDSTWIINEGITSILDSVNESVLSSMEGALGIETFYSTNSIAYIQLQENFQAEDTETVGSKPGSNALLAYDSITIVAKALEKMNNNSSNSKMLLEEMLSANFNGLSGDIRFKERHLSYTPKLRVMELVNKKYMKVDFRTPRLKLARSLTEKRGDHDATKSLNESVSETKRWKVPTITNPLKVALPMNPAFDNFLKISQNEYSGFCIDLFLKIREILSDKYSGLPYVFHPFNESYDALLLRVIDESYDAIVGDVTILANRSKNVSFTQPYTESGLSLVFPAENEGSAWLFMKPFSLEMWIATTGILIYTMIIIWFLEHHLNPEFGGPLKNQISTTLWFAFSSLFFAHREKISSNSARVVVGVWLFLVFVLTSSYTASLSSMLTVKRLESGRDIEWLKQNNLPVACDNSSTFVKDYLVQVYNFPRQQVIDVDGEKDIVDKFKSKRISALFIESPYEKVFLNKYCNDYTTTTAAYKFGGLGFVFQRGAPMAKDFSEAILTLAENGKLKALEEYWLTPSNECSSSSASPETESLTLNKFWGIYFICAATSTICLVLALVRKYLQNHNYYHHEEVAQQLQENVTDNDDDDDDGNDVLNKAFRIGTGLYNGNLKIMNRAATFDASGTQGVRRRNSPRLETISISSEQHNPQISQSAAIEMLH